MGETLEHRQVVEDVLQRRTVFGTVDDVLLDRVKDIARRGALERVEKVEAGLLETGLDAVHVDREVAEPGEKVEDVAANRIDVVHGHGSEVDAEDVGIAGVSVEGAIGELLVGDFDEFFADGRARAIEEVAEEYVESGAGKSVVNRRPDPREVDDADALIGAARGGTVSMTSKIPAVLPLTLRIRLF